MADPNLSSVLGAPVQVAYAVADVHDAARRWEETFGLAPFLIRPHIELSSVVHRGEPATFDHTSAYGQWGDLMIELVQDHGSGPSVVRERFGPDESGMHHLAFIVADLERASAALVSAGHELAMAAVTTGGTEFRFFDARATLGHYLELYEDAERIRAFYDRIRRSAGSPDRTRRS